MPRLLLDFLSARSFSSRHRAGERAIHRHSFGTDEATWSAADTARQEARVLAKAAARQVGGARQIVLLSRSVQGDHVRVAVAIRFGLLPEK